MLKKLMAFLNSPISLQKKPKPRPLVMRTIYQSTKIDNKNDDKNQTFDDAALSRNVFRK